VAVKEGYGLVSYGTLHPVRKSTFGFRVQSDGHLSNALSRAQTGLLDWRVDGARVGAEMPRAGVERRYAPRKLKIAVERFEMKSEQARAREVSERTRGGVRKP